MRAVVTIVVSRADMNRQNHSPEIMIFSLAGPILGTLEAAATGLSGGSEAMLSLGQCLQGQREYPRVFAITEDVKRC